MHLRWVRNVSILALDPGLRIGWAHTSGVSGVLDLREYDDRGAAMAEFQSWLALELVEDECTHLVVERPYSRFRNPLMEFTEALVWAAMATAWTCGVPRSVYAAVEVRGWLIGQRARKKGQSDRDVDAMIAAALSKHGWSTASEHSADAAATLLYHQHRAAEG